MSNYAIANRYAEAILQLAQEKSILEQIGEELQLVKSVIQQTGDFIEVLEHPKVTKEFKVNLVKDSFSKAVSDYVVNLLLLIIERRRTDIIIPMINQFEVLSNDIRSIALAKVYTVKPLSEADKELISKTFAKKTGKETLLIENEINPDLIGGIKIRIGDRIYDGSVKGQLDRLHRQLVATR